MGLPRKWDPVLPRTEDQSLKHKRPGSWHRLREQLRLAHGVFRCRDCRIVSDNLEAHHIVPISVDPTRELDPSNVVFLCRECHKSRHSKNLPPGIGGGGTPLRATANAPRKLSTHPGFP